MVINKQKKNLGTALVFTLKSKFLILFVIASTVDVSRFVPACSIEQNWIKLLHACEEGQLYCVS